MDLKGLKSTKGTQPGSKNVAFTLISLANTTLPAGSIIQLTSKLIWHDADQSKETRIPNGGFKIITSADGQWNKISSTKIYDFDSFTKNSITVDTMPRLTRPLGFKPFTHKLYFNFVPQGTSHYLNSKNIAIANGTNGEKYILQDGITSSNVAALNALGIAGNAKTIMQLGTTTTIIDTDPNRFITIGGKKFKMVTNFGSSQLLNNLKELLDGSGSGSSSGLKASQIAQIPGDILKDAVNALTIPQLRALGKDKLRAIINGKMRIDQMQGLYPKVLNAILPFLDYKKVSESKIITILEKIELSALNFLTEQQIAAILQRISSHPNFSSIGSLKLQWFKIAFEGFNKPKILESISSAQSNWALKIKAPSSSKSLDSSYQEKTSSISAKVAYELKDSNGKVIGYIAQFISKNSKISLLQLDRSVKRRLGSRVDIAKSSLQLITSPTASTPIFVVKKLVESLDNYQKEQVKLEKRNKILAKIIKEGAASESVKQALKSLPQSALSTNIITSVNKQLKSASSSSGQTRATTTGGLGNGSSQTGATGTPPVGSGTVGGGTPPPGGGTAAFTFAATTTVTEITAAGSVNIAAALNTMGAAGIAALPSGQNENYDVQWVAIFTKMEDADIKAVESASLAAAFDAIQGARNISSIPNGKILKIFQTTTPVDIATIHKFNIEAALYTMDTTQIGGLDKAKLTAAVGQLTKKQVISLEQAKLGVLKGKIPNAKTSDGKDINSITIAPVPGGGAAPQTDILSLFGTAPLNTGWFGNLTPISQIILINAKTFFKDKSVTEIQSANPLHVYQNLQDSRRHKCLLGRPRASYLELAL